MISMFVVQISKITIFHYLGFIFKFLFLTEWKDFQKYIFLYIEQKKEINFDISTKITFGGRYNQFKSHFDKNSKMQFQGILLRAQYSLVRLNKVQFNQQQQLGSLKRMQELYLKVRNIYTQFTKYSSERKFQYTYRELLQCFIDLHKISSNQLPYIFSGITQSQVNRETGQYFNTISQSIQELKYQIDRINNNASHVTFGSQAQQQETKAKKCVSLNQQIDYLTTLNQTITVSARIILENLQDQQLKTMSKTILSTANIEGQCLVNMRNKYCSMQSSQDNQRMIQKIQQEQKRVSTQSKKQSKSNTSLKKKKSITGDKITKNFIQSYCP